MLIFNCRLIHTHLQVPTKQCQLLSYMPQFGRWHDLSPCHQGQSTEAILDSVFFLGLYPTSSQILPRVLLESRKHPPFSTVLPRPRPQLWLYSLLQWTTEEILQESPDKVKSLGWCRENHAFFVAHKCPCHCSCSNLSKVPHDSTSAYLSMNSLRFTYPSPILVTLNHLVIALNFIPLSCIVLSGCLSTSPSPSRLSPAFHLLYFYSILCTSLTQHYCWFHYSTSILFLVSSLSY